jgi:hypothetical protein
MGEQGLHGDERGELVGSPSFGNNDDDDIQ